MLCQCFGYQIMSYIFEKPVERGGGFDVLLVLDSANVEDPSVVKEEFSPLASEALSMRIHARKVIARRSADQKIERTPSFQIL